jgi:hypothetical protein
MRTLLLFSTLLGLSLVPTVAAADGAYSAGQTDPQVARLLAAKGTLKWNYGTSSRYGHAEALVAANSDDVARMAVDFAHYHDLHHKFATARVVGRSGDQTDLFMEYPVRIGFITFELSEVVRFQADRVADHSHVIEARGIRGDMSRGHLRITVKPVDPTHSLLSMDVLLDPKIPAPQSLVDEELRDGAEDFVNGLKDKAQGFRGPVVSL